MIKPNIILGICGSIAAIKTLELASLLCKQGYVVQVVLTKAALHFVTPLSLQAMTGRPVRSDLFDNDAEAGMGHIELARWADLILIAPASASFIARLRAGFANDLLSALCLASSARIMLAPAMNQQMWRNPLVGENLEKLRNTGIQILEPEEGLLACGDEGPGRMQEPEKIAILVEKFFSVGEKPETGQFLRGKTLMITAGPTVEDIDPVRFISNRSSGKMGYALACSALAAGAKVLLVSGPVALQAPTSLSMFSVRSAREMLAAVMDNLHDVDIFIACAAVADYRVECQSEQKIKKQGGNLTLELSPNPDILASVAARQQPPYCVGFAAETHNLENYAIHKLQQKSIDMIAANLVGKQAGGLGFDSDRNALLLLWRKAEGFESESLQAASKTKLAGRLLSRIYQHYREKVYYA